MYKLQINLFHVYFSVILQQSSVLVKFSFQDFPSVSWDLTGEKYTTIVSGIILMTIHLESLLILVVDYLSSKKPHFSLVTQAQTISFLFISLSKLKHQKRTSTTSLCLIHSFNKLHLCPWTLPSLLLWKPFNDFPLKFNACGLSTACKSLWDLVPDTSQMLSPA